MQIRVQGQKIQCIRSVYDPEIKRSRQSVIATIGKYADKIPSDGLEALTETEMAELRAWFDERAATGSAADARLRVRFAPTELLRLAEAVAGGQADEILSADHAASIWESIAKVQAAMRKAGHPRPARPAKPAQRKALPGQADLL